MLKIALEESLYVQLVMIRQKIMVQNEEIRKTPQKTCFKDSLKYRSIYLILILSRLRKISVQENLSFRRGCFREILNVNLDQNILTFHLLFGNAKKTGELEYDPNTPLVEYHQNASDSYCFSTSASVFTVPGVNNNTRDI